MCRKNRSKLADCKEEDDDFFLTLMPTGPSFILFLFFFFFVLFVRFLCVGHEPSGTELGCVAKKMPPSPQPEICCAPLVCSHEKKKERKKRTFALSHFEPWGALYCISETTTREPLDQQNWKTVFMRSNGSLSWNTVSVCIYPLWDNISSYCWLFHVYTFHSFMMQIQFALQKQVPPGIQTTGCGSAEMVVAFYVSSGCRLSSSS